MVNLNFTMSYRVQTAKLTRTFILALCAVTASGCVAGVSLTPVTDATQRVEVNGFSVLPPQGTNWSRMTVSGYPETLVIFHKVQSNIAEQRTRGHTFAGGAQLIQLGEI